MKTIEEYGKQLAKSNAIIKKYDHDTENESPEFLKQKKKKHLMNLFTTDMIKY